MAFTLYMKTTNFIAPIRYNLTYNSIQESEVDMLGTHISDLTVDELKTLVRETVEQTLTELLADPDKGLELRESMKTALERSIRAVREGGATYSADEVAKVVGLD